MKIYKVEKKNEKNVLIDREIPENVLSMYINTGWKLKEEKEEDKTTGENVDTFSGSSKK